ncbi:hypothetical protein IGJ00_001879 [Enterococcus sp. AZ062]
MILLGIIISITMMIFSIILMIQKRYFWSVISLIRAIVGFICFFGLKIEMSKVEDK